MRQHLVNTGFVMFAIVFTCTQGKTHSKGKQVLGLLLSLNGRKIPAGTPKGMQQWFCGRADALSKHQ